MWSNRFGRGFGPVVWQITDDDDDDDDEEEFNKIQSCVWLYYMFIY